MSITLAEPVPAPIRPSRVFGLAALSIAFAGILLACAGRSGGGAPIPKEYLGRDYRGQAVALVPVDSAAVRVESPDDVLHGFPDDGGSLSPARILAVQFTDRFRRSLEYRLSRGGVKVMIAEPPSPAAAPSAPQSAPPPAAPPAASPASSSVASPADFVPEATPSEASSSPASSPPEASASLVAASVPNPAAAVPDTSAPQPADSALEQSAPSAPMSAPSDAPSSVPPTLPAPGVMPQPVPPPVQGAAPGAIPAQAAFVLLFRNLDAHRDTTNNYMPKIGIVTQHPLFLEGEWSLREALAGKPVTGGRFRVFVTHREEVNDPKVWLDAIDEAAAQVAEATPFSRR